ncbi:MAG: oligosaccharide flippase family protein, partial [Desulfobacterales bacterium]|nr:oligosaccharide flippase family protein [Desulfobacterales bacterium]
MDSKYLIDKSRAAVKFTLIFKTASQLFGGIAMILLVRALSEAEYGIYNLLYSMISLISMVASLGISNTLQRYVPEYYQKGEFILAHHMYR